MLIAAARTDRAAAAESDRSADVGRFGAVTLIAPQGAARGGVIVFSDPRDPATDLDEAAHAIAEAGHAVAVVDSSRYLATAGRTSGGCVHIDADLSALLPLLAGSTPSTLPGTSGAPASPPILVGSGAGGALAYAALAQSPPGEVAGAIAFEFNPDVPGPAALCAPATVEKTADGFRYPPVTPIPDWWRMATTKPDSPALQPYAGGDPTRIVRVRDYDDLASSVLGILASEKRTAASTSASASVRLEDLPLIPLPTPTHAPVFAIIYSGDGGWRDLDKQIGGILQAKGIPVVGFDTLRYFWDKRTPEETTESLRVVIDHFAQAWNAPNVLLIGFSFGADVLPFAINRLPEPERQRIRQISLLALAKKADFEIHVSDWLGQSSHADSVPTGPELMQLDPALLQCFYGADEKDETACPLLTHSEVIETTGGHHFDGDYEAIARQILDGLVRRGSLPASWASSEASRTP